MSPAPPIAPHRRGADNFPPAQSHPRRRRDDTAAEPLPPPPLRPLSRREKANLSLGLLAAVLLAGLLLVTGASFLDFENATAPASLAGLPAHEAFTPVEQAAALSRSAGVFLRAGEQAGGERQPPALQATLPEGPTHAINNPAPLPPPPTATPEPPPSSAALLPAPTAAAVEADRRALVPTTGWISSYFARGHAGIDIAAPAHQPIVATAAGVVRSVYDWRVSYGRHLIVDHGGGWDSLYAHLTNVAVSAGQQVAAGQVLGWVGATGNATGPHLHFEVRYQGRAVDPLAFLPY